MVRGHGYKCEVHRYTTEDGYVNTLHRIPPPTSANNSGRTVFLQHGLLGTSADFVMGRPDRSLGERKQKLFFCVCILYVVQLFLRN